jgi:hypothetical protein
MSLRIRRGTDAQRSGITFDMGEIVWTTDGQQLWVGDGLTQGGSPVVGPNVVGYGLSYDATTRRIEVAGLSADDITNGVNNKFFATELAQDAAASLFITGTHSNISFVYDDELGKINATVALDGVGLTDIVADTTPQLGGNLDLNGRSIGNIGEESDEPTIGNINITGDIAAVNLSANTATVDTINVGNTTVDQNNSLTVSGLTNLFTLTRTGLDLTSNTSDTFGGLRIFGSSISGTETSSSINVLTSRGTVETPTIVEDGDALAVYSASAHNGTDYVEAGGFGFFIDGTPTPGAASAPSRFLVAVSDGVNGVGSSAMILSSQGVLSAPVMQPGSYTSTQRDALTPVVGMMIYNTTLNKFQGYQNTGGTTLEWVDLS